MKTFWTIVFLLIFKVGFSCSCVNLGEIDKEQFNKYDLIATGKILSIDYGESTQKIEVGIHKIFKGKVTKMTIILSSTNPITQPGLCGIAPKVGEKWLIFADGSNFKFSTDLCTRTQNMTRANEKNKGIIKRDLNFLKKNSTRNKNYCQQWL